MGEYRIMNLGRYTQSKTKQFGFDLPHLKSRARPNVGSRHLIHVLIFPLFESQFGL